MHQQTSTSNEDYTERLSKLENQKWKSMLDVQRPYRNNLHKLNPGKTLDVGCGIGRNLRHLPKGSVEIKKQKTHTKLL